MKNNNSIKYFLVFGFITLFISGCATTEINVSEEEKIESETTQLQESNLLDVGIILFEEGEISDKQKEKDGISEDIRAAESRYMSYHLKETMMRANGWGAIRVLPTKSLIADVHVEGTIISSDGEELILAIQVTDSTGQQWFDKTYKTYADDESYRDTRKGRDVYQYLYNRVANDIRKHRKKLTDSELVAIRNTSELLYAAGLSPNPFAEYVEISPDGHSSILRLPAEDDAMLGRVRKVRDREFLFIDTINEHYDNFYVQMWKPYESWREYYLIEAEQKREVERRAKRTKAMATIIMIAGLFRGPGMFAAGALLFKDGVDISKEAEIHNEAIRELGDSLQAEVSPMVVEIEGRTVELTGSIEEQYKKWRELLRDIYINETGFALEDSLNTIDTDDSIETNLKENTVENTTEDEIDSVSL